MTQNTLDLSGDLLGPSGGSLRFEHSVFPGGEPHFRLFDTLERDGPVLVAHRIRSFNDMGLLLVAIDALRRAGAGAISVFLPYFPAARQDRVMVPGEALTVNVYADLLNALDLREVIVFDPHSDVTAAVLDRCRAVSNHLFIERVVSTLGERPLLVSPDAGALKKVHGLSKALGGIEVVECGKSRDVRTGALSGFRVHHGDLEGRTCLVVDDICDGGGTFVGLAGVLKERGAGDLHLAVSHGIFSKGTEAIAAAFRSIHTTDSFTGTLMPGMSQVRLCEIIQL